MSRRTAVRSFRPSLEALETRDLLSAAPTIATQILVPLGNQFAKDSTAALTRLQTADTALAAVQAGTSHPTSDQAAKLYAQAASAYQEVLTQRSTLQLTVLADLNFFGLQIQAEGAGATAEGAADIAAFTPIENTLNVALQQTITNENTANALAIVAKGVNTAPGANGQYVFATDAVNNATTDVIELNYAALLPSKGAGIVTVPAFDYSAASFPFGQGSFTVPPTP